MKESKLSAVIPAFNKENNLARVLKIVTQSPTINQVIVVNDGSTDNTRAVAKKFGKKIVLISYPKNKGKGYALKQGLERTRSELVLFLDADLIGLTPKHLRLLKTAALKYPDSQVIGIVENCVKITGPKVAMLIGGIRILKKSLLTKSFVRQWPKYNYAVDLMITDYFKARGYPVFFLQLPGMNHFFKTTKWGWREGIEKEIKMYYRLAKVVPKLKSGVKLVINNSVING